MPFFILLPFVLYFLSGCSVTTPAITEYTLNPTYSHQDEKAVENPKSIRITTSETLNSQNSKMIRYSQSNGESGTYLYGRWSDTPANMLTRLLVSSLESEKLFSLVITSASGVKSDFVLESEIIAFDHRFDQEGKSSGLIDVTCRLVNPNTKQSIASKRFIIPTEAQSHNLQGGVSALQKSSDKLVNQQILWIKSIIKNIK